MKSFHIFQGVLFAASLLLIPSGMSLAADAASFDPRPVMVEAQGSGGVPVGTVIAWPLSALPGGSEAGKWLECNGQAVSQSAYPELRAIMTMVPDYRGLFLRGYGSQTHSKENGSTTGVTATAHQSGALGVVQGDAIRNITGNAYGTFGYSGYRGAMYPIPSALSLAHGAYYGANNLRFDASRVIPTATENRPANMAVRYLVRALP